MKIPIRVNQGINRDGSVIENSNQGRSGDGSVIENSNQGQSGDGSLIEINRRTVPVIERREMDYEIILAKEEDRAEIMALYKAQIGGEFCPWTDDYPSNETIDWDLSRDALYVLKKDGKIKAAVSLEKDDDVDALTCWDETKAPEGELARIAVVPDEQSKGLGRIMLQFGMDELKRRGFKGIHMLVNKYNKKAIRCYSVFGFNVVGECRMYDEDFLCYEKEL